jgi:hypothetical protein
MKAHLILLTIVLSGTFASAQQVVDVSQTDLHPAGEGMAITSVNGMVYSPVKFVKVTSGTPFFKEDWMKGSVVVDGGQTYSNVWLRLNLIDNEVNYKDAQGQEMVASSPIKIVVLNDSSKGMKYQFALGDQMKNIDRSLSKTWFQVLVNDKNASLCKQIRKSIRESIAYGTATTEQQIEVVEYYFLQLNGSFARFRWDDWQEQFKDKKDQMAAFIKTHHLKGKSDDDYVKMVSYYNTL